MGCFESLPVSAEDQRLLNVFTTQQHLHPAWTVQAIVARICELEHVAAAEIRRFLVGCGLDTHQAIGRLTRKQITALSMHMAALCRIRHRLDAA